MKQYPLIQLIHIRKHRENTLQQVTTRIEQQLKNIEQKIYLQEKKILEYHKWRLQEEENEYTKLLGKTIYSDTLNEFKIKFSQLKNQEIYLEQELEELQKQEQNIIKELNEKKELLKQAQKNTIKIEKHHEIWVEKEKMLQEKTEEQETEEYKPIIIP